MAEIEIDPQSQDEVREFLSKLSSDPEELTQKQLTMLGELTHSENHGVVSIVGRYLEEVSNENHESLKPILPQLVDTIQYTDSIRRGVYISILRNFDQQTLEKYDPVKKCVDKLHDTGEDDLIRVKACGALAGYIYLYPDSVLDSLGVLLKYIGSEEANNLKTSVGKTLGEIAKHDESAREEIVSKFIDEVRIAQEPPMGVLAGIRRLAGDFSDWLEPIMNELIQTVEEPAVDHPNRIRSSILIDIKTIAEENSKLIEPYVDRLAVLLSDDGRFVRKNTAELFEKIGETDSNIIGEFKSNIIEATKDDQSGVRYAALRALEPFPGDHEQASKESIPLFISDLPSTDAAFALSYIANKYPEHVESKIPDLVNTLRGDPKQVRCNTRAGAASAIGSIGENNPKTIEDLISPKVEGKWAKQGETPLTDAFNDDHKYVRRDVVDALGKITAADPSLYQYTNDIIVNKSLNDEYYEVVRRGVRAIEIIATTDSSVIADSISNLITLLGHRNEYVRETTAEVIGEIAKISPGLVESAQRPLIECLNDYSSDVRKEACQTLMVMRAESAGTEIRRLLNDNDETVRDTARQTLKELGLPIEVSEEDTKSTDTSESKDTTSDETENKKEMSISEDTNNGNLDSEPTSFSNRTSSKLPPTAELLPEPPELSISYEDINRSEIIGRGGNAEVYKATVTVDNNQHEIAVKEPIVDGTVNSEQVAEQFEQEAEVWGELSNRDGVVDVIDWGRSPMPWIAMEYMDGKSLAQRITQIDLIEALWICEQLTKATRHDRTGVVHLDLKPSNVLFMSTPDEYWDYPKLADWGLAKMLSKSGGSTDNLSVKYAAPEQFDPDTYGSPDSRTDIYQLGVLAYELFTGELPFKGGDATVMHSVLEDRPEPPTNRITDIPTEIDDIIIKALKKDPSDRYETVERLQSDISELRSQVDS